MCRVRPGAHHERTTCRARRGKPSAQESAQPQYEVVPTLIRSTHALIPVRLAAPGVLIVDQRLLHACSQVGVVFCKAGLHGCRCDCRSRLLCSAPHTHHAPAQLHGRHPRSVRFAFKLDAGCATQPC